MDSPIYADGRWNSAFMCTFYGGGIIATLVVYGVMQEKIMTVPFGGEIFGVSAFLVLCNRILNVGYASTMIAVNRESFQNTAPMWKYMVISFSNVIATTCQYECLKYVSFPVQMLGKSFKMMPVMMWGIALSGKRFTTTDWVVALCVTLGVTEFCMTGPTSSPGEHGNSIKGMLLLLMFLVCDGLTSTFQEQLFKEHNMSKFNQMFYVSGFSSVISFVTVLAMGKLSYCLAFATAHGDFVANVMVLSSAAAGSQYFIYSQVQEFGALVFAATMNVRQIASILMSYQTYQHSLTWLQGAGLLLVFGALVGKSYTALASPQKGKGFDEKEKAPLLDGPVETNEKAIV